MAKILPFARPAWAAERGAETVPTAATAEIVIFPGVRVEYHDVPPTPTGRPTGRGRRGPPKNALSA